MSRNEGASIPNDESGQSVPIGNTGNLDAIANRETTKQLSDKV